MNYTNNKYKSSFTPRERQAFCIVYKNKCNYCGRNITYYECELDHIIPRSVGIDKLSTLKEQHNLSENFRLDSYENILPSCTKCNKEKSASVKEHTVLATYLAKAKEKAPKILNQVEKLNKKYELDKDYSITISFQVEFRDGIVRGPINKGLITELEHKHIKFLNQYELHLTLTNDNRAEPKNVCNIAEYRDAIKNGFFAASTYSMKSEVSFIVMNSILYWLETAKVPIICSFSNINFYLYKLDLIDSSLTEISIQISGDFQDYKATSRPMSQLIKKNKIKVINTGNDILHIESENGYGKVIRECLRGDFLGNGCQEILCSVYEYMIGGTLGVNYMIVLKLEKNLAKPILVTLK